MYSHFVFLLSSNVSIGYEITIFPLLFLLSRLKTVITRSEINFYFTHFYINGQTFIFSKVEKKNLVNINL